MKTAHGLILYAILSVVTAWAQITTISAPHFGGITTITPTYNGYNYTTIGGPRSGDFGNVQVTGGNVSGIAVGPRGGVYPIVTPGQPQASLGSSIINPMPVSVPEYVPMPMSVPIRSEEKPLPKPKDTKSWHEFLARNGIGPKTVVPISTHNALIKVFNDLQRLKISPTNSVAAPR
jgi:hypothetical protein